MNGCKGYNTKQRAIIIDILKEHKERHYNADEILDLLKEKNTPVGRATLYRYLDYLVSTGEVKRYYIEEGCGACYQYTSEKCDKHYHLKCNTCGRLFHVDLEDINKVNKAIKKQYGFVIEPARIVLYGCCKDCLERDENEK